jgi:hypothetical protein
MDIEKKVSEMMAEMETDYDMSLEWNFICGCFCNKYKNDLGGEDKFFNFSLDLVICLDFLKMGLPIDLHRINKIGDCLDQYKPLNQN